MGKLTKSTGDKDKQVCCSIPPSVHFCSPAAQSRTARDRELEWNAALLLGLLWWAGRVWGRGKWNAAALCLVLVTHTTGLLDFTAPASCLERTPATWKQSCSIQLSYLYYSRETRASTGSEQNAGSLERGWDAWSGCVHLRYQEL